MTRVLVDLALLERLEWSASGFSGCAACPYCFVEVIPHEPDCPLAAAIREGRERQKHGVHTCGRDPANDLRDWNCSACKSEDAAPTPTPTGATKWR